MSTDTTPGAAAGDPAPTAPQVPDLPCAKCGGSDVSLAYCDGCGLRPSSSFTGRHMDDRCLDGDPEHFHRACRRCGYRWRTDDVPNARKVCTG